MVDGKSGSFGCGGENLDQINRTFEPMKCPLCLHDALVAVGFCGDFKAYHAGAIPVAVEVDLRISGVLIILRNLDAQINVLAVLADDIALTLMAVQSQTTSILSEFPTKAAPETPMTMTETKPETTPLNETAI